MDSPTIVPLAIGLAFVFFVMNRSSGGDPNGQDALVGKTYGVNPRQAFDPRFGYFRPNVV